MPCKSCDRYHFLFSSAARHTPCQYCCKKYSLSVLLQKDFPLLNSCKFCLKTHFLTIQLKILFPDSSATKHMSCLFLCSLNSLSVLLQKDFPLFLLKFTFLQVLLKDTFLDNSAKTIIP